MNHTLLLTCLLGAGVVLFGELLRHKRLIANETSRKIIHLAHTFVVAGWPYFISYHYIIAAEILFIGIVITAQRFRLFRPLWMVKRKSWGELFLPAGVIVLCLLQPPAWVFAVALLHVGLADAMAAIIGRRFKSYNYRVWGHKKSIAGTMTFMLSSTIILLVAIHYVAPNLSSLQLRLCVLLIPFSTALAENVSPWGSDNLSISLLVAGLLQLIGLG